MNVVLKVSTTPTADDPSNKYMRRYWCVFFRDGSWIRSVEILEGDYNFFINNGAEKWL